MHVVPYKWTTFTFYSQINDFNKYINIIYLFISKANRGQMPYLLTQQAKI